MHPIAKITQRVVITLITLAYAPVMLAANDWFPKVPASDDMSTGGKSAMTITSNYVKQGMSLILFIAAVGMFVKFISTVSHGIEEAKKSENGSLTVFGTFTVMAIVYLAISVATGYLGYTIITKFQI
jgi:hypothetical protein